VLATKQSFGTVFMLGLILTGCETTNTHETLNVTSPVSSLKTNKTMQPHVAHAFLLMKEEKYTEASSFINQSLQSHPKSVILHILNALTYEKLAEKGDVSGIELAIVGYQNAMSLDPFNSFAITQLGKIRYREQQFDQAQEHFANALLLKPNDPDLIHEFAAASYYAYDIKSALAAIKKAEKLKPGDPLIQRSAAMMHAAVGDFKTAEKHFKLFQAKVGKDPEVAHVANRFNDWQSLYKSGRLTLAAAETTPKETKTKDTDTKTTTTTTTTETTTKKGPPKKKPVPKEPPSKDTGTAGAGATGAGGGTDQGTNADTGSTDTGNTDQSSTDQGAASGTDQGGTAAGGTAAGGTAAGGSTSKEEVAAGGTDQGTAESGGEAEGGGTATGGTAAGSADQGTAAAGGTATGGGAEAGGAGAVAGGADQGGGADAGTSIDSPPPAEGDQATKEEVKRGDLAQTVLNSPVTPGIASAGGAPGAPAAGPGAAAGNQQIIMDCYILQITEDANTSKGNNILDALAVTLNPGSYMNFKGSMWGDGALPKTNSQFTGDKVNFTADSAYSSGFTDPATGKFVASNINLGNTNPMLNNAGSISGRIFTGGLTWAGLTYSLNIANAADLRTEIVSRPTLMTFISKESRFFSGTELVNVSGGTYGSNLSRYQVGVTLAVTPESLVGEKVSLNIGVESSLLQNTNPNLQATVDVTKTKVETTARVRLGETIMLGGIYERTEVDIQSGFPGLRDIPLVQYFFSNQKTISSRRSIVILLTPRSPDAVKSAVNRAMTRESVRPHFSELVSRNPDWFHPDTNAVNIFGYINLDPILYYEFRTGDILPPSWGYDPTVKDKLAELSAFLYY